MWVGLLSAFLLVIFAAFKLTPAEYDCNKHIEADIVYGDTQIEHIRISGTVPSTALLPSSGFGRLPTPIANSQAGENGITIIINNRTLLLFPMGRKGLNLLYVFDVSLKAWDTIHVNCPPQGVSLWTDRILVGFCVVNTSTWCVPYFKLTMQATGGWIDGSGPGLCSQKLTTINLTNPVILQFDTQYGYAVKLYFAERGTNILHEIDLGQQDDHSYCVPDNGEHKLKIRHLVSAIANDGSFTGLRLESSTDNSTDIFNVMFSSTAQSFCQKVIPSETIAFNSDSLEYLVTFSDNLKSIILISKNGTVRSHSIESKLRNPIHCENIIRPGAHHLVCLAANSGPILINAKGGTSQTIPIASNVTNIGKFSDDTAYLLTNEQEMIVLPVSAPHCLVKLTIHNDNLRVMNTVGYNYNSTSIHDDKDGVAVWPIVLSISLLTLAVVITIVLLCMWKKRKCTKDNLSQYLKCCKLNICQDDNVEVTHEQCTEESVAMLATEQRLPPDGKPSSTM